MKKTTKKPRHFSSGTMRVNSDQRQKMREGKPSATKIRVRCITDDKVFESYGAAADHYKISETSIGTSIRQDKKVAGLQFIRID